MSSSKVSFTIHRPSASRGDSGTDSAPEANFKVPPLPKRLVASSNGGSPLRSSAPAPRARRHDYHAHEKDSSDEEDGETDELVTGFDQSGVQRLHDKRKAPEGPLVIPALRNKDWRELARKRKSLYVPPQSAATGADGSVGGLGTRDAINSGPQLSGLQVNKRVKLDEDEGSVRSTPPAAEGAETATENVKKEEETEDARALRAILASTANGDDPDAPHIDAIPLATPAPSEDDVYKQDVEELPESASLEDYDRVPVSQFGAALLRGMGWKEGMAASKKNRGPVEPYLPQARPALLGIGAKEKEVLDDGSKGKKGKGRPERRYVPVIKKERARDGSEDRERSSTRSSSLERRKDRDRDGDRRDRDHGKDRERYRDRDRDHGRDKERDRDRDQRRDDRDYGYDKDRRRDRRDGDHDSSRKERDSRRDRSPDRSDSDRRRDRDRDRRY